MFQYLNFVVIVLNQSEITFWNIKFLCETVTFLCIDKMGNNLLIQEKHCNLQQLLDFSKVSPFIASSFIQTLMGFPIKHAQLSSYAADNQVPVSQNIIPVACKQTNHGFQGPLSCFS